MSSPARHWNVIRHISRAALAGELVRIFDAVRRGETVVVEDQGQPPLAIVDLIDLRILRAMASYYADPPAIDAEAGVSGERVEGLSGQELFDVALACYLAEGASLARTAEILGTSWLELRDRFSRLGVPLQVAPVDDQEVWEDVRVARSVAK